MGAAPEQERVAHTPHTRPNPPRAAAQPARTLHPPIGGARCSPLLCHQPAPAPTSRRACSSTPPPMHALLACSGAHTTPTLPPPSCAGSAARHGAQVDRHAAPLAPRPSPRPSPHGEKEWGRLNGRFKIPTIPGTHIRARPNHHQQRPHYDHNPGASRLPSRARGLWLLEICLGIFR